MNIAKQPLVTLDEKQNQAFKRADLINLTNPYGMSIEELAEFLNEKKDNFKSVLCICNTKNEAESLYKLCDADYLLSTALCKSHRQDILSDINDKLNTIQKNKTDEGFLCVTTQLVEAGVDFSFHCVVRVLAGVDNIAQATGRCNRSYEYEDGKVFIVNLKDEAKSLSKLPDIQLAKQCSRSLLDKYGTNCDELLSSSASKEYFDILFKRLDNEIFYNVNISGNNISLAEAWANSRLARSKNSSTILMQPFKTIGKLFKVFDSNTYEVVVPYKQGKEIIEQIEDMNNSYRYDIENATRLINMCKPYTISIYAYQYKKLMELGLIYSCWDNQILILSENAYDEKRGLVIEEQDFFI